ncbi:unnamed protein product [Owenia fusiformis]|uniref:Uncharacterized protein n=1 Tax=Owenia fusiformis TaxID=6347 RepID=A0A8J1UBJ0_OWEFU|nr:unnamed protein product [Owenia fusiformis]
MIIFKDILTGCELATDASNPVLVDDLVYEFKAKYVTRSDTVDDSMIGGNKSAEDGADEDADGSVSKSGYDVAIDNMLEEYPITDKKVYGSEVKKYMKRLQAKLSETNPERCKIFEEKIKPYMSNLLKRFKKLQFYVHSDAIPKSDDGFPGMIVILEFRENEQGEETYVFQFFKDGLLEEKC